MPDRAAPAARPVAPGPVNEPVLSYAPGSTERADLKARLAAVAAERADIPLVIGGERVRGTAVAQVVMPCAHRHVLATCQQADPRHVRRAIQAARRAARERSAWPWEDRAA